jgi:uncharacterized Rossmann fold enzyme
MSIAVVNAINTPPANAVPLQLEADTNVDRSVMYDYVRAAVATGFPVLQQAGAVRTQPVVIVGSSPNLREFLPDIARLKAGGAHIMAVKGAHNVLAEAGGIPDSAVCADSQAHNAGLIQPRLGVTYYLSTTCHPDTWPRFHGHAVMLWHPRIDRRQEVDPEWQGVRRIWGGTTTGLRAIALSWVLGFRDVTLVGFESCVQRNGVVKATGDRAQEDDPPFPVCFANRWFLMTGALVQQVTDLMPTLQQCPGIKISALGDGALPHVLATGKQLGWPV